jgi:outer membrane protein
MRDRRTGRTGVFRALLLAALVLPGRGTASTLAPLPARTLEEVVAATLASEESLRIVAGEVRKAELRSKRYLLYLTPDVRATGAWTRTGAEDDSGEGGGPKSGDSWAWALSLTQPLYTGGRATAAYHGQKDLEASVRLQAELSGRELALAAAEVYYDALAARESVRIGEQGMVLARRQLERAARRVELGEAVLSDRLRAEVSLRRLEAELAGARSAFARARETVRRLSGLELAEDPVVPAQLPPIGGSDADLVAEALASRLEPRQLQLAVAAAEQDVREKQGRFLPSLALRAAWGEAGDTLWEREWSWTAGLTLEVPIYQSGSTPLELREARVSLDQERLRAEAASRDIEREVRSLLREIEAARSVVGSLRLGVDAAAENLRLAERRYEVGLADSLEVADAQQADLVARVGLATAGFRLETLTLRLRVALGRDIFDRPGAAAAPR